MSEHSSMQLSAVVSHFLHLYEQGLHSPFAKKYPVSSQDKHKPSVSQVLHRILQSLVHVVKSEHVAHILLLHPNFNK